MSLPRCIGERYLVNVKIRSTLDACPYHHGDLRRTLLDTALDALVEHGPAWVSLRDVARRAGVSHAGAGHHIGDEAALLVVLAAEGWSLLADALAGVGEVGFREQGVAYVLFATGYRGHFAVMRAPGLVRADDPDLVVAQNRAGAQLSAGAGRVDGDPATALAGWAPVHGLSALLLEGMITPRPGADVESLARE